MRYFNLRKMSEKQRMTDYKSKIEMRERIILRARERMSLLMRKGEGEITTSSDVEIHEASSN